MVFYTAAIYIAGKLVPGFKLETDWRGLMVSGLTLAVLFAFVNPFLKFLFLPINVLTMGLFSFVSQILTFYIFLQLFPDNFHIEKWDFSGWDYVPLGLHIGSFNVGPFVTIVLSTFLISFIVMLLSVIL